jgi:cysteine desulfurase
MIFLDANAGMPALPEARDALVRALDVVGNPSSTHALGRAARTILDDARTHVARALGAEAKELTFTSGASEANRWLVDATAHLDASRIVSSALEHPSLAKPLAARAVRTFLAPDDDVDGAVIADADVLFVTAAHNETGILPALDDVLARAKPTCIVCVDAAQLVARMGVLPHRVDAIVASAHKIGGYAGAGALVLRGNARALRARWLGGGQEAGLRPGTEALALHAAFGAAAAVVDDTRARHAHLAPLRDKLEAALVDAWGARALGADRARLPNTSALVVTGVDGDALRIAIDGAGVAVGFGSACSAMAPEPSPALRALGLSDDDARSTVRLSLPPTTTGPDVDEAIARLAPLRSLIERSRSRRGALAGPKDRA